MAGLTDFLGVGFAFGGTVPEVAYKHSLDGHLMAPDDGAFWEAFGVQGGASSVQSSAAPASALAGWKDEELRFLDAFGLSE